VFVLPPDTKQPTSNPEVTFDVLRSKRAGAFRVVTLPPCNDSWAARGRRLRTLLTRTHSETAALRALHSAYERRLDQDDVFSDGLIKHLRSSADRLADTWRALADELEPAGGQAWSEDAMVTEAREVERAARAALQNVSHGSTSTVVAASRDALNASLIANNFFGPILVGGAITLANKSESSGDSFTFHGPTNVGAAGNRARGTVDARGWTLVSPAEFTKLADEFATLRTALASEPGVDEEQRSAVESAFAEAETAAKKQDNGGILSALSRVGKTTLKWASEVAEKLSADVAAKVIQGAIGLPG
jgi:hypothetical protein